MGAAFSASCDRFFGCRSGMIWVRGGVSGNFQVPPRAAHHLCTPLHTRSLPAEKYLIRFTGRWNDKFVDLSESRTYCLPDSEFILITRVTTESTRPRAFVAMFFNEHLREKSAAVFTCCGIMRISHKAFSKENQNDGIPRCHLVQVGIPFLRPRVPRNRSVSSQVPR